MDVSESSLHKPGGKASDPQWPHRTLLGFIHKGSDPEKTQQNNQMRLKTADFSVSPTGKSFYPVL